MGIPRRQKLLLRRVGTLLKNEARGRAVQSKNPRERLVCRFYEETPYALNSQTRNAEHNKARMTIPEIITKYFHDLGE